MINVELTEHEYYLLSIILGHLVWNESVDSLLDKFYHDLELEDFEKLQFKLDDAGNIGMILEEYEKECANMDEEPEECVLKFSSPSALSELQQQLIEALSYAVKTQDNESIESLSKAIQRIK